MTTTAKPQVKHAYSVGTQVKFSFANAPLQGTIEQHSVYLAASTLFGKTIYSFEPSYAIRVRDTLHESVRETSIIEIVNNAKQVASPVFEPVFPSGRNGLWTNNFGFYNLKAEYCYPGTQVILAPFGRTASNAPKFRIMLKNTRTQKEVSRDNQYTYSTATRDGLALRYDLDALRAVDIEPELRFKRGQSVALKLDGLVQQGVIQSLNLEYVWVVVQGVEYQVRPQAILV